LPLLKLASWLSCTLEEVAAAAIGQSGRNNNKYPERRLKANRNRLSRAREIC
jgi:hypothetical protein